MFQARKVFQIYGSAGAALPHVFNEDPYGGSMHIQPEHGYSHLSGDGVGHFDSEAQSKLS